jgi:ribosomal-protein-alanine N-acetyltransferase
MDSISIARPTLSDAQELLEFELSNRSYFEQWINARAHDYYNIDSVRRAIDNADMERQADRSHQFIVKSNNGIVGRVNLTSIVRPYLNKATLGYRIGEQYGGRGFATQAVSLVLAEAFGPLGLWRVEAASRPENLGSVSVLEKSGFAQFGRSRQSFLLHGTWYDLLLYERHAPIPA